MDVVLRWRSHLPLLVLALMASLLPTAGGVAVPAAAAEAAAASLQVESLRTNYRTDPLGIDGEQKLLGWQLQAGGRDQIQQAYQVRAASTAARLAAGESDLWDSGKVVSAQSTNVTYAGGPLSSRQQAFWQVRVWDPAGRTSAWSKAATFEMGLLEPGDWQAQWIGNPAWGRDPEPNPVTVDLGAQDARYLRVDVTRLGLPLREGWPYDVSRLQLAELVVRDSATPGANLATGATVTASESYTVSGAWEPRFVVDGTLTSQVNPRGYTSYERRDQDLGTSSIWLQLDLGSVRHFDQLLLYPRTDARTADGRTPNFPVDYSVQVRSATSGPFTVAKTITGQATPPPYGTTPEALPIFAKDFALDRPVRQARLYATGLGLYAATVNGKPVSDAVLEPPNTDYKQRVVYSTYDVTSLLRAGENAIGVELGQGNYDVKPTPGRYQKYAGSQGPMKLLAQLEVTYADGTTERIVSDPSWRTTLGARTASSWYGGEDYDARRDQAGWDTPSADRSEWTDAIVLGPPRANTVVSARQAPPIEIVDRLSTVKVTEPRPGVHVFDMGVNFAGWPQLTVAGPAGTKVTMRPGELLNSDGTVSQSTTGSPIWDTYTLSGRGTEVWHPMFAYHGFRYLQVEGLPGPATPDMVSGLVLRTANDEAGTFSSSHELLNSIHRIIDRAVQSNMYSVLTDCPHREKLGWLEETQLVMGTVSRGYDVAAYYRQIVQDMADAQTPEGLVPDIAPEYTVFSGGFRDDPNWGGAMVLAPLRMYEAYGDVATLRTYYPNMVRYADYLAGKATNNLLSYGLGDWIAFDQSTPLGITATFGYYRIVQALARIATVLGKPADATRWTTLAANIASSFNTAFLDPVRHTYGSGSQAGDAMALDMGVVPDDQRQAVLDHLIGSIQAKGWHLTVGEIALPSVFHVLSAAGRDDIVYDIATQTGNPSYGYQVVHGATSLTENWDGPTSGNSQNHFMLGAIDEWFTSGLAGIKQAAGSVAYHDLVIKPAVVGDLSHVSGSYATPYGQVSSAWRRVGRSFHLDVTVPANTTATVYVPVLRGSHAAATAGARLLRTEDGYAVYAVGSGRWQFTSVTNGTVPPAGGQLVLEPATAVAAVVPGARSTVRFDVSNLTDNQLTVRPEATASDGFTAEVATPSLVVPAGGYASFDVVVGRAVGGAATTGTLTVRAGGEQAEVALQTTDNVMRAATMTASSTYGSFAAAKATDGDVRPQTDFALWDSGGGWNDGTANAFPDTLTGTWDGAVAIDRVRLLTLDTSGYPASRYGVRDYDVEVSVDGTWRTVAQVRGSTVGTVESTFPRVTGVEALRLVVHDTNDHQFTRVVELEAYAGA